MTSEPTQPPPFRIDLWVWGLLLVIALINAAVFSHVRSADFIDLDDDLYVTANPHVMTGLAPDNAAWALTVGPAGFWMPLTWWSLQFDATLTGPPLPAASAVPGAPPPRLNASIFHLDNLFLHILGTSALFLFLYRATRLRCASFVAAMLWSIHPLRVESVAWVTERKDVLSGLFGFLACYLYVAWRERGGGNRYAGMCAALALSLMAKATFVTLPVLLILIDFWPLRRITNRQLLARYAWEKWPLMLISAAGAFAAFFAQRASHSIQSVADVAILPRLENALLSYGRYLWMQIDFSHLAVFYPYLGRATAAQIATVLVVLAGITALVCWQRKKRPWLLAGWLWYVIALLPMSGLVQVGEQAYADRFTYLPSVGLAMMIAGSIPSSCGASPLRRRIVTAIATIVVLLLATFTVRQVRYWHDSITLFERGIAVTHSNYLLEGNLGAVYLRDGPPDLAEAHLRESVRINPSQVNSRLGLGMLYLMERRLPEALPQLAAAVALKPQDPMAHDLYGAALGMSGRVDDAIIEFSTALQLDPSDARARQNLAMALQQQAQPHHPPTTRP